MTAPVSRNPISPLQRVIVARLKGDATMVGLLAGKQAVYDQPPEGSSYPYIRVGDHLSTADNDLSGFGRVVVETLHIWSRVRSSGPGQAIADRATELLDHQVAALNVLLAAAGAGHRVVSIRQEFDQALTDPDPEIRHHILRFRITTAQQT